MQETFGDVRFFFYLTFQMFAIKTSLEAREIAYLL